MNPFRRPYTVKRTLPGEFVRGEYMKGGQETLTASFSVQGVSKNAQIQALAEGRRISDMRRLYGDEKLQTSDDFDGAVADIVVIDGLDYEVLERATWQNRLIPHYRYIVVRKYE